MSSAIEMRIVRLELQAQLAADRLAAALRAIEDLTQALRASQLGTYTGGGGATKIYYTFSNAAVVGSGTWPTFTPGSFLGDVWDLSSGSPTLVESAATIQWWSLDSTVSSGAPLPCVRLPSGDYLGLYQHCTPIPEDA